MAEDIHATLQEISLFKGLSEDQVAQFAGRATTETHSAGEVIIEENTPGRALYVIHSGEARVSKIDGETESTLGVLETGEPFGEMSLIDSAPTSARVSAGEDGATLIVITRDDFQSVVDSDVAIAAKVYEAFTRILTGRLRRTSSELATWKPDLGL